MRKQHKPVINYEYIEDSATLELVFDYIFEKVKGQK
jgi:hypothetical protein